MDFARAHHPELMELLPHNLEPYETLKPNPNNSANLHTRYKGDTYLNRHHWRSHPGSFSPAQ